MNNERVVRVANTFLQLIGYQVHSYEPATRRYRLSLWSLCNFVMISIVYVICVGHHFEGSTFLKLLLDISPFLHKLVRLQLLLGVKVFVFGVYEMRQVVRGANGLAEALPPHTSHQPQRFGRAEAQAYALLFSTLLLAVCIALYIAVEMHFKLPPLDRILVALALFIPHFIVAGALRFYTLGLWLLRAHLQHMSHDIDSYLCNDDNDNDNGNGNAEKKSQKNAMAVAHIEALNSVINMPSNTDGGGVGDVHTLKALLHMHTQLDVLADRQRLFAKGLRRQLLLLLVLNANSLLAGVYMRVYYDATWHIIFCARLKRIFCACNYGLFLLICWDYVCLCATQAAFTRVKVNLQKKLNVALKQRNAMSKSVRAILKDIRDLLANEFRFKLIGSIQLNVCVFVLLQILTALAIAIIVTYQYLKDEIKDLSDRMDDVGATDD